MVTHATLEITPGAVSMSERRSGAAFMGYVGSRPPLFVPRDQVFFWTSAWQAGEAESARAREAGDVHDFDNAEDALRWLTSPDAE